MAVVMGPGRAGQNNLSSLPHQKCIIKPCEGQVLTNILGSGSSSLKVEIPRFRGPMSAPRSDRPAQTQKNGWTRDQEAVAGLAQRIHKHVLYLLV